MSNDWRGEAQMAKKKVTPDGSTRPVEPKVVGEPNENASSGFTDPVIPKGGVVPQKPKKKP
jgi:hypothetical protein